MSLSRYRDIRIDCLSGAPGTNGHEFIKSSSNMQNCLKKSDESEINKNLVFKKNINLYIPLQTMSSSRGYP